VSGANGIRQGPARSYYSNGQLLSSGEFSDGSAHGAKAYYLNEGTIWRRTSGLRGAHFEMAES
jgi:antitoxin component YwqK of YwqJK toxin-antitoxin module